MMGPLFELHGLAALVGLAVDLVAHAHGHGEVDAARAEPHDRAAAEERDHAEDQQNHDAVAQGAPLAANESDHARRRDR